MASLDETWRPAPREQAVQLRKRGSGSKFPVWTGKAAEEAGDDEVCLPTLADCFPVTREVQEDACMQVRVCVSACATTSLQSCSHKRCTTRITGDRRMMQEGKQEAKITMIIVMRA